MKYGILITLLLSLIASVGHCNTDIAVTIDSLDTLYANRQYDSLITLGQTAAKLAEETYGSDDTLVASILIRVVRAYQISQKDFIIAEEYLQRALKITENHFGHNSKKVALILNSIAINYWLTGKYESARHTYEKSFLILQVTDNENTMAMAAITNNLAALCHTVGDYARAEELYLMSLPIREKTFGPDHIEVGKCYNNLGTLYLNLSLYTKAKHYLGISLEKKIKALGEDNPDVASVLLNLGTLYLELKDYDSTEYYFTEALRIYKKEYGITHQNTLAVMMNIGSMRQAQEKYEEADSIYADVSERLSENLGPNHPLMGNVYSLWAELKSVQSNDDKSIQLALKGLKVLDSTYGKSHNLVAGIKEGLTKNYCRENQWFEAENTAAAACRIRNRLLYNNVRILNQSEALKYSWQTKNSLDLFLSSLFHKDRNQPIDSLRAMDIIINSKGQIADCIFQRLSVLLDEQDSTSQRIYTDLGMLKFKVSNLLARNPGTDIESFKDYYNGLNLQIKNKERELSSINPRYRLAQKLKDCTIEMIQSKMSDNSIIVDFIYYEQHDFSESQSTGQYLAIVIDRNSAATIVQLGDAASIDSRIEKLRNHMLRIASVGSVDNILDIIEYKDISQELHDILWEPISHHLSNVDNIIISPDGKLNLLSFAGLLLNDGQYLVEKYAIHYLPSPRDILRYESRVYQNKGLLAIGSPDFNVDLVTVKQSSVGDNRNFHSTGLNVMRGNDYTNCSLLSEEDYGPLPGAQKEIDSIAVAWQNNVDEPAIVLTGSEATELNFIEQLNNKRVIHIATHGFYIDSKCYNDTYLSRNNLDTDAIIENPLLFSGILLAGANNRDIISSEFANKDGVMTAYDITALNFTGVTLVVLSGCETGMGQVVNSDGVYGLRKAFMEAGAQCVVSTLWPIIDDKAYSLLHNLYSSEDEFVARKLRLAQIEIINQNRKNGTPNHPFIWAPFVVYGNWVGP